MSIKIRSSWIDNNTHSLGVRVYRKLEAFTKDTLPDVYATIPKGTTSYEDANVEAGQTYFYMLGVFNNKQEVFTECFEITVKKNIDYLTINYNGVNSVSGGSGSEQIAGLNFQEFGTSNTQQIIVVLAVSFVNINPPSEWVKASSLNNVHIFWKKGGTPHAIHHFQLESSSFLALYGITLDVASAFNKVEILTKNIASNLNSSSTQAISPMLDAPQKGPSYQINTIRLNNLGGGNFVAQWGGGLTKIRDGTGYHQSLCLAGRARAQDSQIGGETVSVNYWLMPNAANLQTIQICAWFE